MSERHWDGPFTIAGDPELAIQNYNVCMGSNWFKGTPGDVNGAVPPDIDNSCSIRGRHAGSESSGCTTLSTDGYDHSNGYMGRNLCAMAHGTDIAPCTNESGLFLLRGTVHNTAIRDIKDGTSNTFLAGETLPEFSGFNFWVSWEGICSTTAIPLNLYRSFPKQGTDSWFDRKEDKRRRYAQGFMSRHPGGANFCLADGSVRFIQETVNLEEVYRAMSTISGAEILPAN